MVETEIFSQWKVNFSIAQELRFMAREISESLLHRAARLEPTAHELKRESKLRERPSRTSVHAAGMSPHEITMKIRLNLTTQPQNSFFSDYTPRAV